MTLLPLLSIHIRHAKNSWVMQPTVPEVFSVTRQTTYEYYLTHRTDDGYRKPKNVEIVQYVHVAETWAKISVRCHRHAYCLRNF
jgi:hypothetical protein